VFAEAPSVELVARLDDGLGLLDLLREVGASRSNGEARRLVEQGAVRLNNTVEDDSPWDLGPARTSRARRTIVLKVGRRRYFLARFR
jgi:tyrosyl-tRNA synthetase